jgi:hypothetical protein
MKEVQQEATKPVVLKPTGMCSVIKVPGFRPAPCDDPSAAIDVRKSGQLFRGAAGM